MDQACPLKGDVTMKLSVLKSSVLVAVAPDTRQIVGDRKQRLAAASLGFWRAADPLVFVHGPQKVAPVIAAVAMHALV